MAETAKQNFSIAVPKAELLEKGYLVVPIQQLQFASERGIQRELAFYLALKMHGDKFKLKSEKFLLACEIAGVKDSRTIKKYLSKLTELNWIGYNPSSNIYHVNGTQKIRKQYGFRIMSAVKVNKENLKHIRAFVFASIVNFKLLKVDSARSHHLKHGAYNGKRLAPNIKRGANKGLGQETAKDIPIHEQIRSLNYVGLSIEGISKLVPLQKSTISELKQEAHKLGYFTLKKMVYNIARFDKPNYEIKWQFGKAHPELVHRVRFTRNHSDNTYLMGIQLNDQITPNIPFKRLPSLNKSRREMNFGWNQTEDKSEEKNLNLYKSMKGK